MSYKYIHTVIYHVDGFISHNFLLNSHLFFFSSHSSIFTFTFMLINIGYESFNFFSFRSPEELILERELDVVYKEILIRKKNLKLRNFSRYDFLFWLLWYDHKNWVMNFSPIWCESAKCSSVIIITFWLYFLWELNIFYLTSYQVLSNIYIWTFLLFKIF